MATLPLRTLVSWSYSQFWHFAISSQFKTHFCNPRHNLSNKYSIRRKTKEVPKSQQKQTMGNYHHNLEQKHRNKRAATGKPRCKIWEMKQAHYSSQNDQNGVLKWPLVNTQEPHPHLSCCI